MSGTMRRSSVCATTRRTPHRGAFGGDSVTSGDPGSRIRACMRESFVEASDKPQGLSSVPDDVPFESSPGHQKKKAVAFASAFFFCFGAQERTRTSTELPAST